MDINYVGKILDGRYEIQEVLGVGGMAVVYRAYDNIDDRPVAVKVLKDEYLANEEFRRRFKNESKAIAMLSHPNIVKVYDVSYGERLQYIVMEYVEGITLKEYIEQRRVLPWKEAVHFLTQILRALQHAHDRGVVHRDVKPQNVMLLHSGNIKVTDFGIARFTRSETRTMSENAIGTVHYISPEQARGDLTDGKSDIYSVGVVLYEMLTGELPFQSDSTVSVAIMQLQSEPRRPREINDQIPLGLEQITIRAMQKAPADRYQSAAEMLLDLEEFKRNPLIRFEYNYYVDREPTKYVSPMETPRQARSVPAAKPIAADEEESVQKSMLPKMVGIVAGIVVVLIIFAVVMVALNSDGDRVQVINFVGMSQSDIKNNADYDKEYEIKWETEASSQPPGTVSRQTPQAGSRQTKVNGKVPITLYVSQSSEKQVPDVVGLSYSDAEKLIIEAGFVPKPDTKYAPNVTQGKVVETDPKAKSTLATGSSVTIYVAVATDTENQVAVPDLADWSLEKAKELLESNDLKLNSNPPEEIASEYAKGKVAWQSIDAGTMVDKNTEVTVKISNGKKPSASALVTVQLPNTGTESTIRIYLGGVLVKEETIIVGETYDVTVEGSGTSSLEARLDGKKAYSATINFDMVPPAISDEQTFDSTPTVPSVLGKTEADAIRILNNAGYDNITVESRQSVISVITSGLVGEQSPSANTKAALDTEIIIYVNE